MKTCVCSAYMGASGNTDGFLYKQLGWEVEMKKL